ncbi:MAG: shikimate kinase [Christensenellales bacterium]
MIKAGLIGGRLSHSQSPQIHEKYWRLTGRTGQYSLFEAEGKELRARLAALEKHGFIGVNVTIPHKTEIIRHLDLLSAEADAIGAVNTIHFCEGRRVGYNTDYFGLKYMLERNLMPLANKRTVILGSGGAARCALRLAKDEGASEVIVVSRAPMQADKRLAAVGYDTLDSIDSIDVLINTTPAGMYPKTDECPVPDSVIAKSGAVADLIYNPSRTVLLKKAAAYGKACAGGLWMLCAQAVKAEEIWTDRAFSDSICAAIYAALTEPPPRTNVVLIGMPGSGKSTVGRILTKKRPFEYTDTDSMIEEEHGSIQDIFEIQGEAGFREMELTAARKAAARSRAVIATGGGIVTTDAAMAALKQTGIVIYIDRPLELLLSEVDISNRPLLANGRQRLISLYSRRHMLYQKYADITVQNSGDAEQCAALALKKLEEYKDEIARNKRS